MPGRYRPITTSWRVPDFPDRKVSWTRSGDAPGLTATVTCTGARETATVCRVTPAPAIPSRHGVAAATVSLNDFASAATFAGADTRSGCGVTGATANRTVARRRRPVESVAIRRTVWRPGAGASAVGALTGLSSAGPAGGARARGGG